MFAFRDGIYNRFAGLFNQPEDRTAEEIEEDLEEESNPQTYQEKQIEQYNRTWGFYAMLNDLADGDYLKIQELYKQSYIGILNHLSFIKSSKHIKKN